MTNEELEERAREYTDWSFDYTNEDTYEGSLIKLVELLTQVRNEAIEEARITAYKKIASRPPFGYGNVHLADGLSQAIEALKDGE